jgi:hypothetical protein
VDATRQVQDHEQAAGNAPGTCKQLLPQGLGATEWLPALVPPASAGWEGSASCHTGAPALPNQLDMCRTGAVKGFEQHKHTLSRCPSPQMKYLHWQWVLWIPAHPLPACWCMHARRKRHTSTPAYPLPACWRMHARRERHPALLRTHCQHAGACMRVEKGTPAFVRTHCHWQWLLPACWRMMRVEKGTLALLRTHCQHAGACMRVEKGTPALLRTHCQHAGACMRVKKGTHCVPHWC